MHSKKGAVDEIIGLVAIVVGLMLIIAFIFSSLITQEKMYGTVAREAHAYDTLSYGSAAILGTVEPMTRLHMATLLADAAYYNSTNLTYSPGVSVQPLGISDSMLRQFFGDGNYLLELSSGNNTLETGSENISSESSLAYSLELPAPAEGEFVNFTLRTR